MGWSAGPDSGRLQYATVTARAPVTLHRVFLDELIDSAGGASQPVMSVLHAPGRDGAHPRRQGHHAANPAGKTSATRRPLLSVGGWRYSCRILRCSRTRKRQEVLSRFQKPRESAAAS